MHFSSSCRECSGADLYRGGHRGKTAASEANGKGDVSGIQEGNGGWSGLPLAAGPGPGYDEPAASCACIGDTAAQSIGAAAVAALPLPLPGIAVAAPSAAKATRPSPAWVCWGSPGAPGQGQWGESRLVRSCLTHHWAPPTAAAYLTSFNCSFRSL